MSLLKSQKREKNSVVIINRLLRQAAIVCAFSCVAVSATWAAEGTHDDEICTLDNGKFCYNSKYLYPEGTNLCDEWNDDGTCSMKGISGGHSGGGPGTLGAMQQKSKMRIHKIPTQHSSDKSHLGKAHRATIRP